jgi:hypothetical protein
VQGIRGDHRPGQVDAVQQRGEHGDLVGLGLDADLPQNHAVPVIERGQQVPSGLARRGGSAQCLAVDRDHPPRAGRRCGALLGPGAGRVIQRVSVQVLQGPPEGGLARHYPGDPERIPGRLVRVRSPLGDRGERPGAGQHRAHRQAQDHRQLVTDAAARAGIGDRRQHRQQPRPAAAQSPRRGEQLANGGVSQG